MEVRPPQEHEARLPPAERAGTGPSRSLVLASSALLVVVLAAVAALLPVPYVLLGPGPMTNTIGQVEGSELIVVEGRRTYPTAGHLDLTTVSVSGGPGRRLDLLRALQGWLDADLAVVPREQVYPPGTTEQQVERTNARDMTTSQEDATAAALRQLDIPVVEAATVASVAGSSPADGVLESGDVVLAVDGTQVTSTGQVGRLVAQRSPGEPVTLTVRRDEAVRTERLATRAAEGDAQRAVVGVTLGTTFDFPFEVTFAVEDIGGPSAGMMFALGIIDKLTPGELNGGRYVAGTGEISPDGTIGPIGGIQQKLVAARDRDVDLFLAPAGNCTEVAAATPEGLAVARVEDLGDAVAALETLREGRVDTLPTCTG